MFHLGRHDRAAEIARAISTHEAPEGEDGDAQCWRAAFLLGQIDEARGRPAEALAHYRGVADRFTDAAEAVASLTRRSLKLPDVATVRPPGDGKGAPGVALTYRNVAEVELKVYPVDLMRFYLSRGARRGLLLDRPGGRPPPGPADGEARRRRPTSRTGPGQLDLPMKEEGRSW